MEVKEMTLELLDGNMITPMDVFDVLDTVEEYLGTEVRQYLEDYLTDEDPWENLPESEKTDTLLEHYQSVLDGIEDVLSDADRLMRRNPVKRKQVIGDLEIIKKMIEKERMNYGKTGL